MYHIYDTRVYHNILVALYTVQAEMNAPDNIQNKNIQHSIQTKS